MQAMISVSPFLENCPTLSSYKRQKAKMITQILSPSVDYGTRAVEAAYVAVCHTDVEPDILVEQAKLDTAGKPQASAGAPRRNEASLRNHIEVDSKTGRPTRVTPTPGATPPAEENSNAAPPPPAPIGGSINPDSENFDFQLARAVDLLRSMAKFAKKPN